MGELASSALFLRRAVTDLRHGWPVGLRGPDSDAQVFLIALPAAEPALLERLPADAVLWMPSATAGYFFERPGKTPGANSGANSGAEAPRSSGSSGTLEASSWVASVQESSFVCFRPPAPRGLVQLQERLTAFERTSDADPMRSQRAATLLSWPVARGPVAGAENAGLDGAGSSDASKSPPVPVPALCALLRLARLPMIFVTCPRLPPMSPPVMCLPADSVSVAGASSGSQASALFQSVCQSVRQQAQCVLPIRDTWARLTSWSWFPFSSPALSLDFRPFVSGPGVSGPASERASAEEIPGDIPGDVPWVRLHSSCFTGDFLSSLRCDCGSQLTAGLEFIREAGGILLYLPQEGRGLGLQNKMRAYRLQEQGLNTYEANHYLGFESDARDFSGAAAILRALGVAAIRLLSDNPAKRAGLIQAGVKVPEHAPLAVGKNPHNRLYLETKDLFFNMVAEGG